MKSRILAVTVICLLCAVFCFPALAEETSYTSHNEIVFTGEGQFGYKIVGYADSNDTALDVNTRTWDNAWDRTTSSPKAGWYEIPEQIGTGILSFFAHGKDGNDVNAYGCDVNVTVLSKWGGVKKVFSASIEFGDIELSANPDSGGYFQAGYAADPNYKWASNATSLIDDWVTGTGLSPEEDTDSETDVLEAYFRTWGNYLINVKFTNIDAQIDGVWCVMRGTGK